MRYIKEIQEFMDKGCVRISPTRIPSEGYARLYTGISDEDCGDDESLEGHTSNGVWLTPSEREARDYGDTVYEYIIDLSEIELATENEVVGYVNRFKETDIIDALIAPWGREWYGSFRENTWYGGYVFKYENGQTYVYLFDGSRANPCIVKMTDLSSGRVIIDLTE